MEDLTSPLQVTDLFVTGTFFVDRAPDVCIVSLVIWIALPKVKPPTVIDYRCDNRRFWLSTHDCQGRTPTSQNLEVEQEIRIF
jgi:hypothetical protein